MDKKLKLKTLLKSIINEVLLENSSLEQTGKTYYYSILRNSKNVFYAEVTDENGNVIFKITTDEYTKFMENPDDIVDLKSYLIKNKIIQDADKIIPEY